LYYPTSVSAPLFLLECYRYPKQYEQVYAGTSLVEALAPLAKFELLWWDPLKIGANEKKEIWGV
jgi:hypothetical protein